jgi:hypothetical protein
MTAQSVRIVRTTHEPCPQDPNGAMTMYFEGAPTPGQIKQVATAVMKGHRIKVDLNSPTLRAFTGMTADQLVRVQLLA